jgi:hypothetical protein
MDWVLRVLLICAAQTAAAWIHHRGRATKQDWFRQTGVSVGGADQTRPIQYLTGSPSLIITCTLYLLADDVTDSRENYRELLIEQGSFGQRRASEEISRCVHEVQYHVVQFRFRWSFAPGGRL